MQLHFIFNETTLSFEWLYHIDWIRVLIALAVFFIGIFISLLIRRIIYRVSIKFMPKDISSILSKVIYYVLVIIVVISTFGVLGVDLTGFIIAGGILGIILGFALQSATSNFVSGLFLFWERPLKIGDLVAVSYTHLTLPTTERV